MPNGEKGISTCAYAPGTGTLVPFGHGISPGTPGGSSHEVLYTVPAGKIAYLRAITAGVVADLSGSMIYVTVGSYSLGHVFLLAYTSPPATASLPSYAWQSSGPQIPLAAGQTIEDLCSGGVTILEYWASGFVEVFDV